MILLPERLVSFALWLLQVVLSLVGIVFLSFLFLKFIPGSPFDDEAPLSPAIQKALEDQWGIHDNVFVQATKFVTSVIRGDLGVSLAKPSLQVSQLIQSNIKASVILNFSAYILVLLASLAFTGLLLSLPLKIKLRARSLIAALASAPTFFWAPFLVFIYGDKLHWFKAFYDGSWQGSILPVLAIFMYPWASLSWVLFDQWDEVLKSRPALFAKAKGLSKYRIIFTHGLKLSLIPFIQKAGRTFLQVMTGSFVVEIIFGVHGLASEFVKAIANRDSTVIAGLVLVYCFASIVVTQLMEFLSQMADPRWRAREE